MSCKEDLWPQWFLWRSTDASTNLVSIQGEGDEVAQAGGWDSSSAQNRAHSWHRRHNAWMAGRRDLKMRDLCG